MVLTSSWRDSPWRDTNSLPADTPRVLTALASLPSMAEVAETQLTAGRWCWNAPLWANPYLPHVRQDGARPRVENEHPDLVDCRELRTLGNLVRARAELVRDFTECGTPQGDSNERASRRANRDWRTFVMECLDPVDNEAR